MTANPIDNFRFVFDKALETLFIDRMEQNEELFAGFMNDKGFQKIVSERLLRQVYEQIREEPAARGQQSEWTRHRLFVIKERIMRTWPCILIVMVIAGCGTSTGRSTGGGQSGNREEQSSPAIRDACPSGTHQAVSGMDPLRSTCSMFSDDEISDLTLIIYVGWYEGWTREDQQQDSAEACGADANCLACLDTLVDFVYDDAGSPPSPTPAVPAPPTATVTEIFADDGQFLGIVNDNSFAVDSIANSFGTYGSPFSSTSMWNSFGTYGSDFSILSPWNDFSSTPPVLVENGFIVAYLTTNSFLAPAIHPNDLAILVGRPEEMRP